MSYLFTKAMRLLRCRYRNLVCCVVVLQLGWIATLSAETDLSGVDAIKSFAETRRLALSAMKSFEMAGDFTVTGDGGVKTWIVTRYHFRVWGKGDRVKEVVEQLDEDGKAKLTRTYYLDAKTIVVLQESAKSPKRYATRFTLGKAPNTGLFNECPALLEYSFLNISISEFGIPALRPDDVAGDEKWATMVKELRADQRVDDMSPRAAIVGAIGSSSVKLRKRSDLKEGFQVESISFFSDEGKILDRRIDVLDYFHDPAFGELGKTFKVSVFRGLGQEKPVAVWEFHCEGLRFNGEIDDASLSFDPRKVDSFYEGDEGIFVDEIR